MNKRIWTRKDIPVADDLLSFREGLIEDFMKGYSSLKEAVEAQSVNTIQPQYLNCSMEEALKMLLSRDPNTYKWSGNFDNWKSVLIRNVVEVDGVRTFDETIDEESAKRYPTAMKLLEKYSDACYGMVYSSLLPYTILRRHIGPENVNGRYIRIHIPLIVPEGDLFLEVRGEETTWDDLFGFNNQFLHSAHNYTDEYRLILIVDLLKDKIGMSDDIFYHDESQSIGLVPFERGTVNEKV